jgi:hypothetical protein
MPEENIIAVYDPSGIVGCDEDGNQHEPDEDDYAMHWQDFLYEIEAWMDKNPGPYIVKGTGMGWRQRYGVLFINPSDARTFVQKVTPKTSDFTFRMYEKDGKYLGSISHHDAPTGEGREFISVPKARLTVRQLKEFFKKYKSEMIEAVISPRLTGLDRELLMEKFCLTVNALELHNKLNEIL